MLESARPVLALLMVLCSLGAAIEPDPLRRRAHVSTLIALAAILAATWWFYPLC